MKTKSSLIAVSILLMAVLVFNSSDAQAEVHVYDNNHQYLGIMTEMGNDDIHTHTCYRWNFTIFNRLFRLVW